MDTYYTIVPLGVYTTLVSNFRNIIKMYLHLIVILFELLLLFSSYVIEIPIGPYPKATRHVSGFDPFKLRIISATEPWLKRRIIEDLVEFTHSIRRINFSFAFHQNVDVAVGRIFSIPYTLFNWVIFFHRPPQNAVDTLVIYEMWFCYYRQIDLSVFIYFHVKISWTPLINFQSFSVIPLKPWLCYNIWTFCFRQIFGGPASYNQRRHVSYNFQCKKINK